MAEVSTVPPQDVSSVEAEMLCFLRNIENFMCSPLVVTQICLCGIFFRMFAACWHLALPVQVQNMAMHNHVSLAWRLSSSFATSEFYTANFYTHKTFVVVFLHTCSLTVNKTLICKLCGVSLYFFSFMWRSYEKYFIVVRLLFFLNMQAWDCQGSDKFHTYSAASAVSSLGRSCLIIHQCYLHQTLWGRTAYFNHHPEPRVLDCGKQFFHELQIHSQMCPKYLHQCKATCTF